MSRKRPMSKTTTPKKLKSPAKPPNAGLVNVKYKNKAPTTVIRRPKNFSARDTQNVSPSLIPLHPFF